MLGIAPSDSQSLDILQLVNVTKTFKGIVALNKVDFVVKQGSLTAIIGPNGAGKSTLLNVISGMTKADTGSIIFGDKDCSILPNHLIALLGMARTFQLIRLFTVNKLTVLDNVLLGAHKDLRPGIIKAIFLHKKLKKAEARIKKKALEVLRFVGLEGMENQFPATLSFGKQRMLELARALMTTPKLLLLDEPASGLNDSEVEQFGALLKSIQDSGMTIILVEHNMKLVMNVSDQIVVLNYGHKIAEGTPDEIAENNEVIGAYLGDGFEAVEEDNAESH